MLRISRGVRDKVFNLTQQLQQNLPTFDPNSTGVIMSTWQEDPELFLYKSQKKGSQLHIWRCQRMSSSMPLTRGDFTDEIPVPNFRSLVKKGFEWSKSYMEALEKYISPRHFLVNCEGLVYVELFKFSEGEKIDDDDDRIYLRLLDVLNMEPYGIKTPKVPFRTVEYIEDGKPASVDPSPNEVKLTSDLTERTSQLKASQEELEKEKSDKEALEIKVAELEAEVTSLKNKETTLSAELDTRTCEVATLTKDLDQEKKDKRTLEEKVANVENKNTILADNEKKLTASLEARVKEIATLQQDLKKEKSDRQELESRVASLEDTVKAILAATKKTPKGKETKTTSSDIDDWTCVVQPLQQELYQAKNDKRALEEQVADLESKNNTLTTNQTKLSEDLAAMTNEVTTQQKDLEREKSNKEALEKKNADLEAKNEALTNSKSKLTEDLAVKTDKVATLQQDLEKEKSEREDLEKRIAELEAQLKEYLEGGSDESDDDDYHKEIEKKEAWMNDHISDDWVGFEKLQVKFERNRPALTITKEGASFSDDNTTNVKADNFYLVFSGNQDYPVKVVNDKDLATNGEKARYDPKVWGVLNNAGEKYAARFKDDDDYHKEIEKKEAWMNDHISDDWVGFEELQVKFERNRPALRITKEGASFSDDNTTNVKADNFYLVFSGNQDYPVKVVNDKDLATNGEKARYDPKVWGVLNNAGEKYAARFKDDE